jgi:signal peptidase I
MSILGLNGTEFHALAGQILGSGHRVRFQASGGSMQPFIQSGDILVVAPLAGTRIKCGDVLLVEAGEGRLLVHRVVKTGRRNGISVYLIKSDTCALPDGWFRSENILGRVEVVERGGQQIRLSSGAQQMRARVWVTINPWVAKFSWLPAWFRHLVRNWLLGE